MPLPGPGSGPIKVLVVDDSVVIRRLVTTVLDEDPDIEVIGTASNGRLALTKLDQLAPDLVTMDIEMPDMDGIAAVKALRPKRPKLPVIMFSTLTERGAAATLDALSCGASDYVTKPANVGSMSQSMEAVRQQLIPKIKALVPRARPPVPRPAAPSALGRPGAPARSGVPGLAGPRLRTTPVEVLAIGSSTGGPDALTALLPGLPADFPVPVVITQHMPPVFTRLFAQRLSAKCALDVREAVDGDEVRPGRVLVAPGDFHLELERRGTTTRVRLTQSPPENFCRPAVDVMFRSVASLYADRTLAVVLTGMGSDGMRGAEPIRAAGGDVVVQDERTSVVWGMPGAVAGAGLASKVLPLEQIAAEIRSTVDLARGAARATPRPTTPLTASTAAAAPGSRR